MNTFLRKIAIFIATCGLSALAASAHADTPPCNSGLCTWPVSSANTVAFASDSKSKFEPSGLSWGGAYLYIASDNGQLARVNLSGNGTGGNGIDYQDMTAVTSLVDTDFESITNAGGALFIGVEGDSDSNPANCTSTKSSPSICPTIYEYYPNPNPQNSNRLPDGTNTIIGRSWILKDLPHNSADGGMEAMTFVPDGRHPFTNSTGGFNGVFLAASQADKTKIYAYDLQQDGSVVSKGVIQSPVLGTAAISEMFYSWNYDTLFVLYDESIYQLQEIRMTPPAAGKSFGSASQIFLSQPLSPTGVVLQGIEGLALVGQDLFIAIDQKKNEAQHNGTCTDSPSTCSQFTNCVYRYKSYPMH